MRIAFLFNYPLADNTAWKQRLVRELRGRHEMMAVFGKTRVMDYARTYLRRTQEDDIRDVAGPATAREPRRESERRTVSVFKALGVPVHRVRSLNDAECGEALSAFKPDYVVTALDHLLGRHILATAPIVLNVHYGVLPEIKGWNATEWSLLVTGTLSISLHRVVWPVDSGEIYLTKTIDVTPGDGLGALRERCQDGALELYTEFFRDPDRYRCTARPNVGGKAYYVMNRHLKQQVLDLIASGRFSQGAPRSASQSLGLSSGPGRGRTGTTSDDISESPSAPGPYLLVSPCRDEEQYVRRTLDSVASQTVPPARWIIVDDGSTDGTPAILAEYARRLPYLQVVRRADRGHRRVGPGVVEAFYAGLDGVDLASYAYLCKLDLDLDLPPRYFELLLARMQADPRLGTVSGKPYFVHPGTGELVPEVCGDEMSVGMTKFYRTSCFREIGGFVREVMWDGIDCHRCRMLGWIAESVDDEALHFTHLRPMASSERSITTGRMREGYGQYFMGSSPFYMLARTLFRLPTHPVIYGALATLWGYTSSAARGAPRYGDAELRRFIRRYQHACLLFGKGEATRRLNGAQADVWRATHEHAACER